MEDARSGAPRHARDDDHYPAGLAELLRGQCAVLGTPAARTYLSRAALRWRLRSGRWQQPCREVVVAQSGPLSAEQTIWVAVLWAGPGALLAGLTAARLDGLSGFDDRRIHVLLPAARQIRKECPPFPIVVHRSRLLGSADIHPARRPPRTRLARSLVDAAAWMSSPSAGTGSCGSRRSLSAASRTTSRGRSGKLSGSGPVSWPSHE